MVQVPRVAETGALLRVLGAATADEPASEESSDCPATELISDTQEWSASSISM